MHTLVSSVLILNTDLYSNMVTNKMSQKDFIINTQSALNENEKVSESILKVRASLWFDRRPLTSSKRNCTSRSSERKLPLWSRRRRKWSVFPLRLFVC